MRFTQPNNLSRVMSQILNRLDQDVVLTLEFSNEEEVARGLEMLHEVATQREIGVLVTPRGEHSIELRLVSDVA
jgi:hypothetical protein